MRQNKYELPLSVKAFWRGDDNSNEEIVTMPCDKDDSPDFYLLCDANNLTVAGDWADGTENAYYALADIRDRANALAGIPTESLPEVKKAWAYCQIMLLDGQLDDFIFNMKLDRKHGKDIGKDGKFNTLLDSLPA